MNRQTTGLTYQSSRRTSGFRLSVTDVVVLSVASAAGAFAYSVTAGYSLFVPFVVYHFFLFCNVFRVPRKPELIWSGIFLVNCTVWTIYGPLQIPVVFGSQLLVTVVIILYEIRQPSYHGIFSRQLNPEIDAYLEGRL